MNQLEDEFQGRHPALARMGEITPKEIPFFAARVLAKHESKQAERQVRGWKMLALATSLLSVVFFLSPTAINVQKRVTQILSQQVGDGIAKATMDLPQLAFIFSSRGARLEAYSGKPIVIYMAMDEEDDQSIVQARVNLPEGVSFISKKHPEIAEKREITLSLKRTIEGQESKFPFVIQGKDVGEKLLHVEYLDGQGRVVMKRDLSIHFLPPAFPNGLN